MPYLFADAPRDDVWLAAQARALLTTSALTNPPLSASSLLHLTQSHSIDLATACFDQALRLDLANAPFIRHLDAVTPACHPLPGAERLRLLIVPGLFYREHPEIGSGGTLFSEIAQRCGIHTHTIPTRSVAFIEHNVPLICAAIEDATSTGCAVWLLSISKGALDLKAALWSLEASRSPALSKIAGWINVSGIAAGSDFAPILLRSFSMRWLARLSLWPRGSSLRFIHQLRPDHPYARPYAPPPSMTVINVCPIPLAYHLRTDVHRRYHLLSPLGPNDGLTLLGGSLILPGLVYPLWGCDHYLRSSALSALTYQLLASLSWAQHHPDRILPPPAESAPAALALSQHLT